TRSFCHGYDNIISVENLLRSWQEFICGKRNKKDVAEFAADLMDNILELRQELLDKNYKHSQYEAFTINDPKTRSIHKASVRDRLLHHAIVRILYPYFDKKFIYDSYSCRLGKGTHRAVNRLNHFGRKVSKNNTKTVWILKCDVRKFFASIDKGVLKDILRKYIQDSDILWLLGQVVDSFQTEENSQLGLPLGNLTSQLLINVYMNEFDQFVKHVLKVKHYIRYADDFVILNTDKSYLIDLLPKIETFLSKKLKLTLHPNKVSIKTLASGIDFLGWVNFPEHRVLRTSTKRRMLKRLKQFQTEEMLNSCLGLIKHGNTLKLQEKMTKDFILKTK
ncbi:MAG: RNA-directed DNA polymerase, partial [Candidatus Collierbacteria bacterium GW2011_GWC2_44_18]